MDKHDINLFDLVDIEDVLYQLLVQIRKLTFSDAGTIYLKDGNNLKFCVFQNDSLPELKLNHLVEDNKFLELPLNNRKYIAVECFLSSNIIKTDNIYDENILDVSGIKAFDNKFVYRSHSMLTVPLIDLYNKRVIGVLQIINKVKNGKFIPYSDSDVELIKMSSNFIGYTISKTIEFKSSLSEMDKVIKKAINVEIRNKLEIDRLNSFHNKISHISKVLSDITHQWKQPLCELSINNTYLTTKLASSQLNEILNDNESIIQSLSSIINDFEMAYECERDDYFSIYEAFQITFKLIKFYINSYEIDLIENIDKNIMIKGKKNIFIQVILSILQNSLDAVKRKKIRKPFIQIKVKKIKQKVIVTFEDNAGGISEDLLLKIFELTKNEKIKSINMTLNLLKIVLRDRFDGDIFAKNTKLGLMIKIVINQNNYL